MWNNNRFACVCLLSVLMALGVGSVNADTIVAQWPKEWKANEQGANGWYYKYYTKSNGNYRNLPWNSDGYYGWADLNIKSSQSLSSTDGKKQTALTWKSDVAGTLKISGKVSRLGGTIRGADGCTAYIFLNGSQVYTYEFGNGAKTKSFDIEVSDVEVGDSIYFCVDQGANNWGDKVHWTPTISTIQAAEKK